MRKITLILLMAIPFLGFSQTNVTFQVDMNTTSGFTTPELNGTFNNWCGNCTVMSDANNDGIWDVTVLIPAGTDTIEYKFSADNWNTQENLNSSLPCVITDPSGQFTNRYLVIGADTTLPVVCWESCGPCSGTPTNRNVTFQVDLSEYTGSYTNVNLNGDFNNWCGSCAVMTDVDGDSIYELEVTVPVDTIEYKFTLDGWTVDETLTQGDPCTKTTTDAGGTFTNRFLAASGDTTLAPVCWESCSTCGSIGLEENWVEGFTLSPNPSTGLVQLEGQLPGNTSYTISVYDVHGKLISNETYTNSSLNQTLDLSTNANGMYLINISSKLGQINDKVMIQR